MIYLQYRICIYNVYTVTFISQNKFGVANCMFILKKNTTDISMTISGCAMSSGLFTCITCRVGFRDGDLQRNHYKTDWHR